MASNGRDALEIFPAEIWELILEKLRKQGSSQDVVNCSKVCKEFERILEPTKHDWLFESICPFLFPYMKGGELLACRKISKNWRRGVDNCLADFETWRPFNEGSDISHSSVYDPLKTKRIKWTEIRDEGKLVKCLDAMEKKTMKTPFVGRSLYLEVTGFGCLRRGRGTEFFVEKALEMLGLYGGHIWHLRVLEHMHPFRFYQLVKQMLSCTPNLKSLTIETSSSDHFGDDNSELNPLEDHLLGTKEPTAFYSIQFHLFLKHKFDSTPDLKSLTLVSNHFTTSKDDKSGVKEPLEDHPLGISSLETLEISTVSGWPILVLEKLMKKINLGNLKCLKLHHPHSYTGQPSAVQPFQHLTELHVSSPQWEDVEHIFNNLISPTAPLAKVSLDLRCISKEIDFDRACNLFNRWKESLRMVIMKGSMTSIHGEPPIFLYHLDAPYLKSLELDGIIFGSGLLNPMLTSSLEYLHLRYTHVPSVDPGKKFYECVFQNLDLHKSSIWWEMEKLKVVRVERSHPLRSYATEKVACTREMHERGIRPEVVSN